MKKETRNGLMATGVVATIIAGVLITAKTAKAAPEAGSCYGTVLDANTGLAIGGVKAELTGHITYSTIAGEFNLVDVPAGTHTLRLTKLNEYEEMSMSVTIIAGQSIALGVIHLIPITSPPPGTGQIYGGVTEDGDLQIPVPNMLVIANGHSTTTDINGGWELWLPAGSYTVTISKEGYATQSRQMAAEVGKSNGWHIEYGPW